MTMTDPVADLLTRIRNGLTVRKKTVDVPYSKLKDGIAKVMVREGFVSGVETLDSNPQKTIRITLKYGPDGEDIIRYIQRESRPGCRVYRGVGEIKKVLGGVGISIFTTTQGILTDAECRQRKVGGEVLCTVW